MAWSRAVTDIHNLLRPLSSRPSPIAIFAAGSWSDHGTGWVERIVVDDPEISTYFTPLSICLNVDSFEHLEFETRLDQLLVYTLVQGDERVVIEFAPVHAPVDGEAPIQQVFRFAPPDDYVQMELERTSTAPRNRRPWRRRLLPRHSAMPRARPGCTGCPARPARRCASPDRFARADDERPR